MLHLYLSHWFDCSHLFLPYSLCLAAASARMHTQNLFHLFLLLLFQTLSVAVTLLFRFVSVRAQETITVCLHYQKYNQKFEKSDSTWRMLLILLLSHSNNVVFILLRASRTKVALIVQKCVCVVGVCAFARMHSACVSMWRGLRV